MELLSFQVRVRQLLTVVYTSRQNCPQMESVISKYRLKEPIPKNIGSSMQVQRKVAGNIGSGLCLTQKREAFWNCISKHRDQR